MITSKDNILIKQVMKLARESSYRNEQKLAVISGKNLVVEALKSDIIESVLVDESSIAKYTELLQAIATDKIYHVSAKVMEKLNLVDTPTDIVALIKIKEQIFEESIYSADCVILDNIADPGNLGTILRAAVSSGVKNVLLTKGCVDIYNPKVLRSSAGIQFGLNIFSAVNVLDFIAKYKEVVVATTPYTNDSLYAINLCDKVAWVFGNEGAGISQVLLDKIDKKIKIPMVGAAESLNVAMAATVCLFEMVRQRVAAG